DPSYTAGQVWEAARKEWIWEDNAEYEDKNSITHSPIEVSGVYINGNFSSSGFYIDYPNGRVVFDDVQTGPVQAEYSYRVVQTLISSREPWFKELQAGSFRVDDTGFSVVGSGGWNTLAQSRVQLPAVVIEI